MALLVDEVQNFISYVYNRWQMRSLYRNHLIKTFAPWTLFKIQCLCCCLLVPCNSQRVIVLKWRPITSSNQWIIVLLLSSPYVAVLRCDCLRTTEKLLNYWINLLLLHINTNIADDSRFSSLSETLHFSTMVLPDVYQVSTETWS